MNRSMIVTSALALFFTLPLLASPAGAADYDVDNSHSQVVFNTTHLNVGSFWGQFNKLSGVLNYDPATPTASTLELSIDAASVFTAEKKRDTHLKSPDFLSVKQYPAITFKSKSVTQTKDGGLLIKGDLTLRGVTKEITATATKIGEGKDPWGNHRVGFEARFTIDRHDYGVDYMKGALGAEVKMIVAIEGIQRKAK